MHCTLFNRRLLERQAAKRNVYIDAGSEVLQEKNTAATRKLQNFANAWNDTVSHCRFDDIAPVCIGYDRQCVDVLSEPRSSESRRRNSTNDHRWNVRRSEPLRHIRQCGLK